MQIRFAFYRVTLPSFERDSFVEMRRFEFIYSWRDTPRLSARKYLFGQLILGRTIIFWIVRIITGRDSFRKRTDRILDETQVYPKR